MSGDNIFIMKRWFAIIIFLCFLITPQAQEEIQSEAFVFMGLMTKAQHGDPEDQYQVGRCFYDGTFGVDQDYAMAIKWFEKAALQNNASAQYYLGVCYDSGYGVEKNEEEAMRWYRKAASQGQGDAIKRLGPAK